MPTPRKEATVAELSDMLSRATMTVVADYRGLKVHGKPFATITAQ